tara:strand:- start:292 stop:903 length:612 start_codon:yes stop_codon:yes gene_type:complete
MIKKFTLLKINLIFLFFLGFQINNLALAKNTNVGMGEVKLSEHSVKNLKTYNEGGIINGRRATPLVFILSSDGKWSTYYYCPYSQCRLGGYEKAIRACEQEMQIKCGVFAFRRVVYWDNGINQKSNKLKLKKKWDMSRLKSELTEVGFYEDGESSTTLSNENSNKTEDISGDITEKLQKLIDMYDSGIIDKEEFEKAKKQILE